MNTAIYDISWSDAGNRDVCLCMSVSLKILLIHTVLETKWTIETVTEATIDE